MKFVAYALAAAALFGAPAAAQDVFTNTAYVYEQNRSLSQCMESVSRTCDRVFGSCEVEYEYDTVYADIRFGTGEVIAQCFKDDNYTIAIMAYAIYTEGSNAQFDAYLDYIDPKFDDWWQQVKDSSLR